MTWRLPWPASTMAPDPARPRTRGECIDGPRPCPWTVCRYHLRAPEPRGRGGPAPRTPHALDSDETCALDVADDGEHTHVEIGRLLGLQRQRVQQIEAQAVARIQGLVGDRRLFLRAVIDSDP